MEETLHDIEEAIRRYLVRNGAEHLVPRAALFDMDGVLYDSMRFHSRAWCEVAEKYHLNYAPIDFFLLEGRTGKSTINILYNRTFGRDAEEAEWKQFYKEKTEHFRACNSGDPMPGASDVLKEAKLSGMKTLLVTGSGQASLIDKLNQSYPGCFKKEDMVTAYDVTHGKPNPEPYLKGLEKAGVNNTEAFVIENAPLGVEAASKAHIFTIAVNTGPLPDRSLLDAGADLLLPDMMHLATSWKNIIKACHSI